MHLSEVLTTISTATTTDPTVERALAMTALVAMTLDDSCL